MLRLGYMGIPLSNSEEAALSFAKKHDFQNYQMIPLMCSANVVESLEKGDIDVGVVAVKNAIAGTVKETELALKNKNGIEIVDTIDVPIHHCLFTKSPNINIKAVASHVQALLQTKDNLQRLCPETERIEVADTAYAAEMLAKGELSTDVAVVCRKEAGIYHGLILIKENIEDDKRNMTSFSMMKIRP